MNNKLTFADSSIGIVDDSNLYGGVYFEQNINPDLDLTVGTVSSAKIVFTTDAANINLNAIGKSFEFKRKGLNYTDFEIVGIFNITEIEKVSKNIYKVTAYDNVSLLDKDVRSHIYDGIDPDNPPSTTLGAFFNDVCTWCGCTAYRPAYIINSNIVFKPAVCFGGNVIIARELLYYVAQAAGGFLYARWDGMLEIRGFQVKNAAISNSDFTSAIIAEYKAPKINTVHIGTGVDDIGHMVGDGTNVLELKFNSIITSQDEGNIDDVLTQIYNNVHGYPQYTPMIVSTLDDKMPAYPEILDVGDEVFVWDNNQRSRLFIFSKKFDNTGFTFECTGGSSREFIQNTTSDEIIQLAGAYHILKDTVTEHTRELGVIERGFTRVEQTAETVSSIVQGTTHVYKQVLPPTQDLHIGDIWYNTSTEVYKRYMVSPTPPFVNSWVDIDADEANNLIVVNSIYQTLDGVVYDNGSGTTVINGDNITTGTIQADRLNLTGEITFQDLNSEVQQKINSSGEIYRQSTVPSTTTVGALWYCTRTFSSYEAGKWYTYTSGGTWESIAEANLPGYIHSTYISQTEIQSPTITGNNIKATDKFQIIDASGSTEST